MAWICRAPGTVCACPTDHTSGLLHCPLLSTQPRNARVRRRPARCPQTGRVRLRPPRVGWARPDRRTDAAPPADQALRRGKDCGKDAALRPRKGQGERPPRSNVRFLLGTWHPGASRAAAGTPSAGRRSVARCKDPGVGLTWARRPFFRCGGRKPTGPGTDALSRPQWPPGSDANNQPSCCERSAGRRGRRLAGAVSGANLRSTLESVSSLSGEASRSSMASRSSRW